MKSVIKILNSTIVIVSLVLCSSFQTVSSEEEKHLLDSKTHSALTKIHKAMDAGEHEKALGKLNKLVSSEKLKDYDAAVVYQTMGFAENGLGNFKNAAKYFVKALSFNALPKKVNHELLYSTAQLLIHIEKPKEGLVYLSKWFADETNPKADAYISCDSLLLFRRI